MFLSSTFMVLFLNLDLCFMWSAFWFKVNGKGSVESARVVTLHLFLWLLIVFFSHWTVNSMRAMDCVIFYPFFLFSVLSTVPASCYSLHLLNDWIFFSRCLACVNTVSWIIISFLILKFNFITKSPDAWVHFQALLIHWLYCLYLLCYCVALIIIAFSYLKHIWKASLEWS